MARLRKEKGQSSANPKSRKSTETIANKPKGGKKSSANENILTLGGSKDDVELLKNPTLTNDVSKFLRDLNLKDGLSETTPKSKKPKPTAEAAVPAEKKPSKKDRTAVNGKPEIAQTTLTSKKKEKKNGASKPETTTSISASKTTAPTPLEAEDSKPKVQLPTKISFNSKSQFVFQPTAQWYNALPPLPAPTAASGSTISPTRLSTQTTKAAELHEADIFTFQTSSSSNSSSSEASFLAKIIQSGTLSDRLSALTLLVQSSPLHNIKALETLKGMAERGKGKGGREESLKALRCIVDWWVGGGAPSRKLKYFRDQPLLHPSVTNEYLVLWYFEDWLKKYFFSILQILETLSLDPLPYVRTQTINLIFTLLRDKSEQEQNLLRLLVNKLGDTEKSLASRASYHLLQLLQTHPAMKGIIVREIVSLVLRPPAPSTSTTTAGSGTSGGPAQNKHIRFDKAEPSKAQTPSKDKKTTAAHTSGGGGGGGNTHARYYATVTFNQIVLTPTPADREVAIQLIDVYFEMFKELLGEGVDTAEDGILNQEEDDGKGKGVSDAKAKEEFKTDKGGRIRDGGGKKGKGKQIEVRGAAGFTEVEDSNSKLVSAILTGVNRALPFAKIDAGDAGINKHIDTLFLITHTSTFNISLQALVLIQQITASLSPATNTSDNAKSKSVKSSSTSTTKSITDRYYRTLYASLHDSRLATSSKQAMYLNLFFKSVKADAAVAVNATTSVEGAADAAGSEIAAERVERSERVKALIRRFLQVLVSGGGGAPEFIAGGLYLLGELFSSVPGLRSMINQPPKPPSSTQESSSYDPRKREPQFAHASALPLWELTPLLSHYHPAVSLHARQLLTSVPLTASPDLAQNTLSHFLERFVYKNPKKPKVSSSSSGVNGEEDDVDVLAATRVKLVKGDVGNKEVGGVGGLVNEKAFLRRRKEDVPVDQLFFHQYFTKKAEKEKAMATKLKRRKEGKDDELESDEDSEGGEDVDMDDEEGVAEVGSVADEEDEDTSELDEDEVWQVMKASMPRAEGDDDDLLMGSDVDEDEDEDLGLDLDEDDDDEVDLSDDDSNENDTSDADDALSLIEGSDNEDLISLDGDLPDGLIEYDGSDASDEDVGGIVVEEEEWGGIGGGSSNTDKNKKRKREETSGEKRKKLRSLPTFASYEDYAKMIEDGPEDVI
ncbi:hypothetical protein M413DRAFT_25783 [Hebeloma cylindrosporum]|uniref:CCAAT-binding factor domain-containing protein n=1 Tax=Hebeloma cylindrosporum TaxID=76867 RepID=A0A0C2Y3D5_HEBCY|nr:hypothetical protein M413DRAFT_25783 [Hebeloma cylindrosporum h7]